MHSRIVLLASMALLAGAPAAQAADVQINAATNAASFSPPEVTVSPGDTVTVSRAAGGAFAHNVRYDDLFGACPATPTTTAWSCPRTFTAVGKYTFHCDLHTSMQGTVQVGSQSEGPSTPPPPTTPPTSGGVGAAPNSTAPAKASFAGTASSFRTDGKGRFRFSFRATPGLQGSAVFESARKVHLDREGERRVTFARSQFTVPASGKVTLTIALSKKNLGILASNGNVRTKVVVTLRDSGLTSTARKLITLSAKPA